ncbi:hypothetical protein Tco_0599714 [Tanacetum coccineum]
MGFRVWSKPEPQVLRGMILEMITPDVTGRRVILHLDSLSPLGAALRRGSKLSNQGSEPLGSSVTKAFPLPILHCSLEVFLIWVPDRYFLNRTGCHGFVHCQKFFLSSTVGLRLVSRTFAEACEGLEEVSIT